MCNFENIHILIARLLRIASFVICAQNASSTCGGDVNVLLIVRVCVCVCAVLQMSLAIRFKVVQTGERNFDTRWVCVCVCLCVWKGAHQHRRIAEVELEMNYRAFGWI